MIKKITTMLLLLVVLAACDWEREPADPGYSTVEYLVTGTTARADIDYLSGLWQGRPYYVSARNSPLPWAASNAETLSGDGFYLSAQSNDATGDLTVTVLIDGIPVATETTITPFGFVAVYGVVP